MKLRTGLPTDVIERNLDELEKQAASRDFNPKSFRESSPLVAEWMQNRDNAAVAHDDIQNLTGLEWLFRAPAAAFREGEGQIRLGQLRMKQWRGTATPAEIAEADRISGIPSGGKYGADSFLQRALISAAKIAPTTAYVLMKGTRAGLGAGLATGGLAAVAGGEGPQGAITVPAAALTGFTVGSGVGAADATFEMETGLAYDEYLKYRGPNGERISPSVARVASGVVGLINNVLEMFSVGVLVKALPGGKALLRGGARASIREALATPTMLAAVKNMAKDYAEVVGTETFTEVLQEASTVAGGEIAKKMSDGEFTPTTAAEFVDRLAQTAIETAQGMLVIGGVGVGTTFIHDAARARRAVRMQDGITALGESAKASKLRERLPEKYQEFVAKVREAGPVENVYVPVEAWKKLFQSANLDPASAAAEVTGDVGQYFEADQLGGDLVIPLDAYVAKIAGSDFHERLAPDIRLHQGDMTLNEAEAFEQAAAARKGQQTAQRGAEDTQGPVADAPVVKTPEAEFQQKIQAQLQVAGQDEVQAETGAGLATAFFRTLGHRVGMDLFGRYQVDVGADRQAPAATDATAGKPARRKPLGKQSREELYAYLSDTHWLANGSDGTIGPSQWTRFDDDVQEMRSASSGGIGAHILQEAAKRRDKIIAELVSRFGETEAQVWDNLEAFEEDRAQRKKLLGSSVDLATASGDDSATLFQGPKRRLVDLSPGELVDRLPQEHQTSRGDVGYTGPERRAPKGTGLSPAEIVDRLIPLDEQTGRGTGPDLTITPTKPITTLKQDERGYIQIDPTGRKFNIRMLGTANRSTFLHEMGHLFLSVLNDIEAEAPEEVQADIAALREWLGNDGLDFTTEQQEQFARGFEAYLMEGKAPSAGLRAAFARFKSWLVEIYRDMLNLNVQLTDDVRGVMDRMLASETEIKAAREQQGYKPLFASAKDAGATDAEFEAYQRGSERAAEEEGASLLKDLMDEEQRESRAWWQAEEERTRAEVAAEYEADPAWQTILALREKDGAKLSRPLLVQRYGKSILRELPRSITAEEGADPDHVAALYGYESGDALMPSLIAKRGLKYDREIERETQARMAEKYPGYLRDSRRLAEAAQDAVHQGRQAQTLLTELKFLGRQLGQRLPPNIDQLREDARRLVGRSRVRDLAPFRYQQAEATAARMAEKFGRKGDLVQAETWKRKQLLNHLAYRIAKELQEKSQKAAEYLAGQGKDTARARLGKAGPEYLEQVDAMLERFDFKAKSLRSVDRATSLAEWIKGQEEQGLVPEISDAMRQEAFRTHWKNLTPDQLFDLRDAVKNIVYLAGLKNKLTEANDARELQATVDELSASIAKHATRTIPERIGARTPTEKKLDQVGAFFASHRKLGSLVREMDGQQDNGPMFRLFLTAINDAQNREAGRLHDAGTAFQKLFDKHYKRSDTAAMSRVREPVSGSGGLILSHWDRLMIALNSGNDGNRTKLLAGYNWLDEGRLQAVLDSLEERDWQFVQGVWDLIDSYWEEIKAKQQRVTGLAPEKVEAREIRTRFGTFRGGYFPIIYDAEQSPPTYANEVEDQARLTMQGAVTRATTRRGHTIERVENVERPILLSPSVIVRHLHTVIHDLTHHEMLIDANRILRHKDVSGAIQTHYGNQTLQEMKSILTDLAAGGVPAALQSERFVNYLRSGATTALLGFNVITTMLQWLGLSNSIVRIGAGYVAKGMQRWLRSGPAGDVNTLKWIQDRSEFMKNRTFATQRDLHEALTKIEAPGRLTDLRASYFTMIAKGQLIADIPTWLGAYEKAFDTVPGISEPDAVALADQAVKDSQGGGLLVDLARVERGGPWKKLFTMFYTYGNVVLNQNIELAKRAKKQSVGATLIDAAVLNILPVAFGWLLKSALHGEEPDPKDFGADFLASLLNMLVYVREFTGLAQDIDYQGPAGLRIIPQTGKLAQQIGQGELDENFWKSLNMEAGLLLHYPALQAQRTAEGAAAIFSGKTVNPAALLVGPPRTR